MLMSVPAYPETPEALAQFWQGHVARWRASGQSQAAYCREQQLSVHRLRHWKTKFERQALPSGTGEPGLIPVQVQVPLATRETPGDAGVRVWLNERCWVEVAVGFDQATLAAVLQVLET